MVDEDDCKKINYSKQFLIDYQYRIRELERVLHAADTALLRAKINFTLEDHLRLSPRFRSGMTAIKNGVVYRNEDMRLSDEVEE